VRLRGSGVKGEGFLSRRPGLGYGYLRGQEAIAVRAGQEVRVGQSGVCGRVAGIGFDGLVALRPPLQRVERPCIAGD